MLIYGPPSETLAVHERHEIPRCSWLVRLKPASSRTTPFVRGAIAPEEDPLSPPRPPSGWLSLSTLFYFKALWKP